MKSLFIASLTVTALITQATASNKSQTASSDRVTVTGDRSDVVVGSGRIAQENRSTGAFKAISSNDSSNVIVTIGERHSVSVSADDNLLERISTRVEDGVLKISSTGSYTTRTQAIVTITMPALSAVQMRGSGDATINGLKGGDLSLTSQGSGDFSVTGRADTVTLLMRGSGDADLGRLAARAVDVKVYGSGSANVRASGAVTAGLWGSGNIRYAGTDNVTQRVYGTGTIRRAK